ncbi:MAG: outer membrane beta-barrel protein [Bacteroidota bacterium]
MSRFALIVGAVFLSFSLKSQYYIGPKIGGSLIDHVYEDSNYETDTTFNVPVNLNWQAGVAVSYSAGGMYSVYGELMYERIAKTVRDSFTKGDLLQAEMTNHFISAPIMLRMTFGQLPFHYYVNGGPRLSYWLGGSGSKLVPGSDEFLEEEFLDEDGNPLPLDYKVTFNSSKAQETEFIDKKAFVARPNRLQFGLTAGGGVILDVFDHNRLQIDFRYTWVHSSMARNSPDDDEFFAYEDSADEGAERENFEYYHNIASISIAYMWGYDSNLRRKGKSTIKKNKKK